MADRFGAPHSVAELHADVLQHYLRRRERDPTPPASPD
jgi:hypothetical protein